MLTSKERARLRSEAQSFDTIFYIGKAGLSDEIINQIENAINARELIKLGVQENCEYTAREAADIIAPKLRAEVVAVIGRKFVLWRKSDKPKKNPAEPKKQAVKPLYKAKAQKPLYKAKEQARDKSRTQARGKVIRNTPKSKKQVKNGK